MKYSPNTNNINDFFSLEKTGNKKGKQTNKVNNKKSKERLKEKNPVTRFLVTPLPRSSLRRYPFYPSTPPGVLLKTVSQWNGASQRAARGNGAHLICQFSG